MKIYCIIVYTSVRCRKEFHATISRDWLSTEPHLQEIQNNLHYMLPMMKDRNGTHTLTTKDQIYYAYLEDDKLIVTATDEALPPYRLNALLTKICLAKDSQALNELIINPEKATESKIEIIQEKIDDTKETMLRNIEKMIERGGNLEQLLTKTEELTTDSFKFSQRSNDLKNTIRCPGLFSLFSTVRDWFTDDTYEYNYEPLAQSKL